MFRLAEMDLTHSTQGKHKNKEKEKTREKQNSSNWASKRNFAAVAFVVGCL